VKPIAFGDVLIAIPAGGEMVCEMVWR